MPGWLGSRSQGREMEHRLGVELAGDSVTPSLLAPPPLKKTTCRLKANGLEENTEDNSGVFF